MRKKAIERVRGVTDAEELPAVGYLKWPIPRFPGNCWSRAPSLMTLELRVSG